MSGVTTNDSDSSVLCDVGIMMMIPGYTQGTAPQSEEAPSPEPGTERTGLRLRLRGSDTRSEEPGPVLRHSRCWMYLLFRSGGFESLEIFEREIGCSKDSKIFETHKRHKAPIRVF